MERQYIFFRTGPALLAFGLGLMTVFAAAMAVTILFPQPRWLALAVIALVAITVTLGAIKLDKVLWQRHRHRSKREQPVA